MTERPILFSSEMVNAILAGRKTMTRRIIKPQPHAGIRATPFYPSRIEDGHGYEVKRKFYLGDRLWVRETWREYNNATGVLYRATDTWADHPVNGVSRWRPSIFMPRRASRINLEVTEVRVERLRSISEEDAEAEGVTAEPDWTAAMKFAVLWDRINGKTFPWESNPWVWVVGFRRIV